MGGQINRQDAIKYFEAVKELATKQIIEWRFHTTEYKNQVLISNAMQRKRDMEDCIMYFTDIPSVDVRPVVRGHWIAKNCLVGDMLLDEDEYYLCSNCHEQRVTHRCNFCPNCGADMRT